MPSGSVSRIRSRRMRRTAPAWVCCLAFLAPFPGASADIIHLKDGTKLEGEIQRTGDGWVVTDAAGKVTVVDSQRVKSFQATANAGADVVADRLASLRRSVQNQTDVKKVLERYRAFIAQYPHTDAARQAQADVEVWRQRLDQGMIKVGDQWVTPAERDRIHEQ